MRRAHHGDKRRLRVSGGPPLSESETILDPGCPCVEALPRGGIDHAIVRDTMMQPSSPNPDPRFHVANVKNMLDDIIHHLREDIRQFNEPKAQALFETSAAVLQGLQTAFSHYEVGQECGMRR